MRFVRRYLASNGFGPSRADMAAHLGVHTRTVGRLVEQLVAAGALRRLPGMARAIEPVGTRRVALLTRRCPLCRSDFVPAPGDDGERCQTCRRAAA